MIFAIPLIYQSGSSLSTGIIMNDSGKWLHILHSWLDLKCPWLLVHGTVRVLLRGTSQRECSERKFYQYAELRAVHLVICLVEKLPWDKNICGV